MIINNQEAEANGILRVAELMCLAARTAPKARGVDHLVTAIISGETKQKLADEMRRIGEETGTAFFVRDAKNAENAPVVVLFGSKIAPIGVPVCGFCGFGDCAGMVKAGGICAYNANDLGIAVGSAVSIAANHRVDSRVMFSIGRAALNLGLLGGDVGIALGVPLSVSGKSPFFDRG